MNETPAATKPVTDDTNEDLTNNDTNDFEVVKGVDPSGVTYLGFLPAGGEGGLKQRLDVANGEEDVTGKRVSMNSATITIEVSTYPSRRRPAPGMTMLRK